MATALTEEEAFVELYEARENGFNCSLGGGVPPMLGRRHSEESKKKMGAARIGNPISDYCRQVISLRHTGKVNSPETRRKMSEGKKGNQAWKGKKHRPESLEKLRASLRLAWFKRKYL